MELNLLNKSISRAKAKQILFFTIRAAIAVGLLLYLISFIRLETIIKTAKEAKLFYAAAGVLLLIPNLYLQFAKWKITCRYFLNESQNKNIAVSLFHGFTGAPFTPYRIGEYFGRAVIFKEKPMLQIAAATFVDKFFNLLAVCFFGSISTILFMHYHYQINEIVSISLFIVVFTLFYFVVRLLLNEKLWQNIFTEWFKKIIRFKSILELIRSLKKLDKNYLTMMIIISVLFYFCYINQFVLLMFAFSGNGNYLTFLWAAVMVMFVKVFIPSITLGELGVRETAAVYFLTLLSYEGSAGFNSSMSLYIINILIPALIGLLLITRKYEY